MRRTSGASTLSLAVALAACHHAAPTVPDGATRARWLAARTTTEEPTAEPTACPTSEQAIVVAASERHLAVREWRAASAALRRAAEVPDARPLGLRLTNVRVDGGLADRAEAALRFRPERPGTIAAERDVIRREADVLEAKARDEARIARAEVRLLLARARAGEGLVAIAWREVEAADAEVATLATAARAEAARQGELALAELALADARAEHARRAAERDLALGDALARAGIDRRCKVTLSSVAAVPSVDDPAALDEAAFARHPLVDERWAAEQGAAAERHLAVASAWPWFDFFQVGVERRADPRGDETHVVVGLEIELPIFLWGGEATEAADARYEAERAITRATLQSIADEVAAARAALDVARARVEALPPGITTARLEVMRRAVREGNGDARELARVERDGRRFERQRVEALRVLEEATIRLDAALGR